MKQRGFSTVELIIALALGLILTLGVVEIYTGSKQTYRTQAGMARMQESARYALETIARDLRMAGYAGCNGLDDIVVTSSVSGITYTADNAVFGNQSLGSDGVMVSGGLPANMSAPWRVAHTDVLRIQSAGRCTNVVTTVIGVDTPVGIAAGNNCGFAQNQVALLANCSQGDLFRISNAPGTDLAHATFANSYLNNGEAEVMNFASNTYFIGTDTTYGLPGLFVIDNTAPTPSPVPVIDGVENMQIEYGIDGADEDHIPNRFVNADGVTDWSLVVAVRITLLMRTIENLGGQGMTFSAGGTTTDYAAGPIRLQFTTTVKLRNRTIEDATST